MKIASWALALATFVAVPAAAEEWVKCALEGGYCKVNGSGIVKYGAGNRWATLKVTGGVPCSPVKFGDPAVGTIKACYIVYQNAASRPAEFRDPPRWVKCAPEGGVCRFDGRRRVTYGVDKRWVRKVAIGSISCSPAGFGSDPALGTVKSCFYDAN